MPYVETENKCFWIDLATFEKTELIFRGIGSIEKPSLSLNLMDLRFNSNSNSALCSLLLNSSLHIKE